jgi:hypothetical protein
VNAIAIYVEGGGDGAGSNHSKRDLRRGFDSLFRRQKRAAQAKKLGWQLFPCGSRRQAYNAFCRDLALAKNKTLCILLVDSETAIDAETNNAAANARIRVQHLTTLDGWNLTAANPEQVHLMVQCMETWIVADPDAVQAFYGKNFHRPSLPIRQNLEDEPKLDVYAKLDKATSKTIKGKYAKIKHASKLLERIDPAKIGPRCPRFVTFSEWLDDRIAKA